MSAPETGPMPSRTKAAMIAQALTAAEVVVGGPRTYAATAPFDIEVHGGTAPYTISVTPGRELHDQLAEAISQLKDAH